MRTDRKLRWQTWLHGSTGDVLVPQQRGRCQVSSLVDGIVLWAQNGALLFVEPRICVKHIPQGQASIDEWMRTPNINPCRRWSYRRQAQPRLVGAHGPKSPLFGRQVVLSTCSQEVHQGWCRVAMQGSATYPRELPVSEPKRCREPVKTIIPLTNPGPIQPSPDGAQVRRTARITRSSSSARRCRNFSTQQDNSKQHTKLQLNAQIPES